MYDQAEWEIAMKLTHGALVSFKGKANYDRGAVIA
jgi:hypothetical protein